MPSMEYRGDDIWSKECTVCQIEFTVKASTWDQARTLMIEFFHEHVGNRRTDDLVSRCRSCNSNKRHGRAADKHRDVMLTEQDNKCAICSNPVSFSGQNAAMDHCHNTGIMRKILCKRCNFLMQAVDDAEWLAKAIAYRDSFRCE